MLIMLLLSEKQLLLFSNQKARALDAQVCKNSDSSEVDSLSYKLGTIKYQSKLASKFDSLQGFKATSELDIKLLLGVLATYQPKKERHNLMTKSHLSQSSLIPAVTKSSLYGMRPKRIRSRRYIASPYSQQYED